ncbi:MAG: DUF4469 domain-containing protein [Treponema sp.]|jgi:hypothetical protein|nr:DUF4469 domain-containing protein [Treponema sp.]
MQKEIKQRLHRIRVRLYPNYLPTVEGKYLARTANEAFLSIEEVAASLKNRGGFTGSFDDLVEHIRLFLWETCYQLADGFGINLDYFSLQPNIGGTFNKGTEMQDDERHPVSFRFRTGTKLKKLADEIDVIVEGVADCTGWLDEFIDVDEDSTNAIFVPGDQFILNGSKIKVVGSDPSCGVFFSPVDNPAAEVRVTRIAENSRSKIIGICPQTGYSRNKIVVRTQYSGSLTRFLKTVRVIESSFTIEEA